MIFHSQESWDPTEIITLPIHPSMLRKFVLTSVAYTAMIYSFVIIMLVRVVGKLGGSSIRRRPHWNLSTTIHFTTVLVMWNLAALTLTFLLLVLCGLTPTKSNILPSILGCTYLSSVAFTPMIICLIYCYFCSCLCSIDITKQRTEHLHLVELLLFQIVTKYISTRNTQENQFDDTDATSKLIEVQISPSSHVTKPTKYVTYTYSTQECSNPCNSTSSQTQNCKLGTSSKSVENPLSAQDQQLFLLLLQQIFGYYLIPSAIAIFFGVSIFSILSILDWGSQLQRWPVPMILGTTVGHACGTAYAVLLFISCAIFSSKSTTNAQHSYHNTGVASKME
jgi:hypothetical protein